MADADAEEAFLNSMKEMGDSTGAYYGAVGADAKQTESTSSDEYDPAQALPAISSPQNAQDSPERVKSPAAVNLTPLPESLDSPVIARAENAVADPKGYASDGDRSQSRSMSGSSTSSSPAVNQVSTSVPPANAGSSAQTLLPEASADDSTTSNIEGVNRVSQSSASLALENSSTNNIPPKPAESPHYVSVSQSSDIVQNGVSHTLPIASATVPNAGSESFVESTAKKTSATPQTPSKEVKASNMSKTVSSTASGTAPRARLPHDRVGILEDRIKEDPRGDLDAWLSLIGEHRKRGKLDDARNVYERFFITFPSAVSPFPSISLNSKLKTIPGRAVGHVCTNGKRSEQSAQYGKNFPQNTHEHTVSSSVVTISGSCSPTQQPHDRCKWTG